MSSCRRKGTGLAMLIVGVASVCSPSDAAAHLVTTGMGPVYDGIGHLLLTPEDLIPVLALALYAGLRGVISGRRAMFLLPLAWFVGGIAGSTFVAVPSVPLPVISFLLLGSLVAADLRMPDNVVAAFAVCLGLFHGFFNGAALKDGAGALGLLGIGLMIFVFIALLSAFVVSLQKPWARIAVRVAGSWIFACGILMLGWMIKGKGG